MRVSIDPFDQSARPRAGYKIAYTATNVASTFTPSFTLTTPYHPQLMAATIHVSHKGKNYAVQVDLTNTISSFQAQLEELTSVPVGNQKLLFKGKKTPASGNDTLETFGLKDGIKVQMLGTTAEEVSGLRAVEEEKKRKEQILKNRETHTRVRQSTFTSTAYRLTVIFTY